MDYRGKDVPGAAVVVYLGASAPSGVDGAEYRRLMTGRNRYATDQKQAAASIGPVAAGGGRPRRCWSWWRRHDRQRASASSPISRRLSVSINLIAPNVTASDEFFTFLFSRSKERYEELKRLAEAHDALPSFRLDGVTLTFNVDADYEVVRTQLTHNVVGASRGQQTRS